MMNENGVSWQLDGTLDGIGSPQWLIDKDLQALMVAFEDAGHQIFAVGGCVRDTVLERVVNDVDLSTDALPSETVSIIEGMSLKGNPWKAVPTGIEHGTVTAIAPSGGNPYEITTFRTDLETDGRHASVSFSKSIRDDAIRRDFTINAFYADRAGRVQDIVGGSSDLAEQKVRFIGDPSERINEDFLRILRFFRFTASHGQHDDGIDPDGLDACARLAEGLEGISRERIGGEMTRILMESDPSPIIGTMEQSGVLVRILPGASVLTLARLIDLEENARVEDQSYSARDLATRLAALGCTDISDRLRLSKKQAVKIDLVRTQAGLMTPMHELGYRFGFLSGLHCALLRWATLLQPLDKNSIDQIKLGAEAEFPIQADDIMPAYQGKALGDRLAKLETEWLASEFELTKTDLMGLS